MQSKAANQPLTIETGQALANTGRWETRQELPVETEILTPDYLPAVFKIVKVPVGTRYHAKQRG